MEWNQIFHVSVFCQLQYKAKTHIRQVALGITLENHYCLYHLLAKLNLNLILQMQSFTLEDHKTKGAKIRNWNNIQLFLYLTRDMLPGNQKKQ